MTGGLDIPEARELAPDPAGLYRRLKRVSVTRVPHPVTDNPYAAKEKPLAADLRALQSWIVPVPPRDRGVWLTAGVLRPLHPALGDTILRFDGLDLYDADCGVRLGDDNLRSPGLNIIS